VKEPEEDQQGIMLLMT